MILGFSGSRAGMANLQIGSVLDVLWDLPSKITELHHGDAIGADHQMHLIIREHFSSVIITAHPCNIASQRAYCGADKWEGPLPPLERNSNIVAACAVLLATPAEAEEVMRSGTWATVRRARKAGKPIVIVLPDGSMRREGGAT